MTPPQFCLSCHSGDRPDDDIHARHAEGGVPCHRCHVPSVDPSGRRQSVHDHKFFFGDPDPGGPRAPGETCAGCHGDSKPASRG